MVGRMTATVPEAAMEATPAGETSSRWEMAVAPREAPIWKEVAGNNHYNRLFMQECLTRLIKLHFDLFTLRHLGLHYFADIDFNY